MEEEEEEEEDRVELGRPPLPRWIRFGALVLAVLAALALLAVHVWPGSGTSRPVTVPPSTPSAPTSVVSPERSPATPTTTPWPTAPGACGSEPQLAIVSSTPRTDRTGIRVLLGGDRLQVVNFDSGDAVALNVAGLQPGEYAAVLAGAPAAYATTATCEADRSKALRIGADRRVSVVGSLGTTEAVLVGGDRAWVVSYPAGVKYPYGAVRSLGGNHRVRLPAGFYPYAAEGNTLVGVLQPDQSAPPIRLLLVDATTGRTLAGLGPGGQLVATGGGQVAWTTGCDASRDGPCVLHSRRLSSGSTTSYRLPRPACCGGPGVITADGTLLAFLLERATTDARYQGHPTPPSDVAVLHLDTGRLEIVPGVEIPAKSSPGLAYSTDGRWLAIALDAGTHIRLLAWRSGLTHPHETNAIPGQVLGRPTIVMLPPPTQ